MVGWTRPTLVRFNCLADFLRTQSMSGTYSGAMPKFRIADNS